MIEGSLLRAIESSRVQIEKFKSLREIYQIAWKLRSFPFFQKSVKISLDLKHVEQVDWSKSDIDDWATVWDHCWALGWAYCFFGSWKIMKHDSFLWARRVLATLTSHPIKNVRKKRKLVRYACWTTALRRRRAFPNTVQIIQYKAYSIYIPLLYLI